MRLPPLLCIWWHSVALSTSIEVCWSVVNTAASTNYMWYCFNEAEECRSIQTDTTTISVCYLCIENDYDVQLIDPTVQRMTYSYKISWKPSNRIGVTYYRVAYRQVYNDRFDSNPEQNWYYTAAVAYENVTSTILHNLSPNTLYSFCVLHDVNGGTNVSLNRSGIYSEIQTPKRKRPLGEECPDFEALVVDYQQQMVSAHIDCVTDPRYVPHAWYISGFADKRKLLKDKNGAKIKIYGRWEKIRACSLFDGEVVPDNVTAFVVFTGANNIRDRIYTTRCMALRLTQKCHEQFGRSKELLSYNHRYYPKTMFTQPIMNDSDGYHPLAFELKTRETPARINTIRPGIVHIESDRQNETRNYVLRHEHTFKTYHQTKNANFCHQIDPPVGITMEELQRSSQVNFAETCYELVRRMEEANIPTGDYSRYLRWNWAYCSSPFTDRWDWLRRPTEQFHFLNRYSDRFYTRTKADPLRYVELGTAIGIWKRYSLCHEIKMRALVITLPNGQFDGEYARCKIEQMNEKCWQHMKRLRQLESLPREHWMVQPKCPSDTEWWPIAIPECKNSQDGPCTTIHKTKFAPARLPYEGEDGLQLVFKREFTLTDLKKHSAECDEEVAKKAEKAKEKRRKQRQEDLMERLKDWAHVADG